MLYVEIYILYISLLFYYFCFVDVFIIDAKLQIFTTLNLKNLSILLGNGPDTN